MQKYREKKFAFRFFLFVTALIIGINNVVILPVSFFKVPLIVNAADSGSTSTSIDFANSVLECEKSLIDNGDGTFTFKMNTSASYALNDMNINASLAQNGYYTIEDDGTYLMQIWGGKGGNGSDTIGNNGGLGGDGGYVHGTIAAQKGDILYYTLGGNGESETRSEEGGGINGDGGGHGTSGSHKVGGGGGYSAIFLLKGEKAEEFKNNNYNFTEDIRKYNVIMVAGGGGGGGADGTLELFSKNKPHGGDGGNINTSIKGTYDKHGLKGTFFAGTNGKSSGSSTAYIGIGGSDIPGAVPQTKGEKYSTSFPNDWFKDYHADLEGGAGGGSNLRGGAGGAGLNGGSGGIMQALLQAKNVGGGGGGSSFISESVQLPEADILDIYGESNNSETGGAISIKRLPDETGYDYLKNISIQCTVSRYFDIISVNGETNIETQSIPKGVRIGGSATQFSISGSVEPTHDGKTGEILTLEILFKPKQGFHGGNMVPVFDSHFSVNSLVEGNEDKICTIPVTLPEINSDDNDYMLDTDEKLVYSDLNDPEISTSCVNVPLTFSIIANAKTVMVDESYNIPDLHDQTTSIGDTWTWKGFIKTINNLEKYYTYTVYDSADVNKSDIQNTTNISQNEQKLCEYIVQAYVPAFEYENNIAVGTPVTERTFVKSAYVNVIEPNPFTIDGYRVKMWRSLSYDNNNKWYNLKTNVKLETTEISQETYTFKFKLNPSSEEDRDITYDIKTSGKYRIDIWGADGGKGGDYDKLEGGNGGIGGYISGTLYLSPGDTIYCVVGQGGRNGKDDTTAKRESGEGGQYSSISLNSEDSYIIIAGGGGGGSAPNQNVSEKKWEGIINDALGKSVSNTSLENSRDTNLNNYNGGHGVNDNYGGGLFVDGGYESFDGIHLNVRGTSDLEKFHPSKYGKAGKNYVDTNKVEVLSTDNIANKNGNSVNTNAEERANDGKIIITLLPEEDKDKSKESVYSDFMKKINSFIISENFSRYFDISKNNINYSGLKNDQNIIETLNIEYDEIQNITTMTPVFLENIITETSSGENSITLNTDIEFSITVPLIPKPGFLGGNDVPLLENISISHGNETIDKELIYGYKTDYVNVALNTTGMSLTAVNQTVTCNDTLSPSQLYFHSPPTITEDWQDDYITIDPSPIVETYLSAPITKTTRYPVKYTISPSILSPESSNITSPVIPITYTVTSTVYVNYRINYDLSSTRAFTAEKIFPTDDINYDIFTQESGADYTVTIKPDEGFTLDPQSVTINDIVHTDYTFDQETGILTLPKDSITNNITISAVSLPREYSLHYVYEKYIEELGSTITNEVISETKYKAGETINTSIPEAITNQITDYPGHEFEWDWGVDEDEVPVMGSYDYYVLGTYIPKNYNLKINYKIEGKTFASETVQYNTTYSVLSPDVPGYIPDKPLVSGIMPSNDLEIDVNYTSTKNTLYIVYLTEDKEREYISEKTYKYSYNTNDQYNIPVPQKPGYQAYDKNGNLIQTISGTLPEEGTTIYVYYKPQKITVTINSNGGNCLHNSITVYYNETYGYNDINGEYSYNGMPVVLNPGNTFTGWTDQYGNTITEETIVTIAENHTITANWDLPKSYTLTINYKYAYNNNNPNGGSDVIDQEPVSITLSADMSYSVPSPKLDGYTPDIDVVTGYISDSDVNVTVYYTAVPGNPENTTGIYTITLNVYDIKLQDTSLDIYSSKLRGGAYKLQQYCNNDWIDVENSIKECTNGTVQWTNVDTRLVINGIYRIVSYYSPTGYKLAKSDDFTFNEDKSINIFLDYAPCLPYTGDKSYSQLQQIGLFIMAVSVLLWFRINHSKTDKYKSF